MSEDEMRRRIGGAVRESRPDDVKRDQDEAQMPREKPSADLPPGMNTCTMRDSAGNILRAMAHRGHHLAEEYAALAKLADFAAGTLAEAALYNLLATAAGHIR